MNSSFNNLSKPIAVIIGLIISTLGLVVIIGWIIQSVSIVKVLPTLAPMQFNTALMFILCGTSLLAIMFDRGRIGAVLGIIVLIFNLLTLSQYILHIDFGIDQLFIEPFTTVQTSHPGRMSPASAICFILTGIGLIVSAGKHRFINCLSVFGSILGAIGLTVILGYLVNLPTSYWWGQATQMAAHTAFSFLLLGIGFFFVWKYFSVMPAFRCFALSVGTASLLMTIGLWQAIGAQRIVDQKLTLDFATTNIKEDLKERFNQQTKALERMAIRWDIGGGTPRSMWESDARHYVEDFKSFQTMIRLDTMLRPQWMIPDNALNEKTKIETTDFLLVTAQTVRAEQKVKISRVVSLPDGEKCLFIFTPVMRGNDFDGEFIAVINLTTFINTSISEINSKNYLISLYDGEELLYTSSELRGTLDNRLTKETEFNLDDIHWRIVVSPQTMSANLAENILPTVFLIVGLFISLLLTWVTYITLLSRRQTLDGIELNVELSNTVSAHQRTEQSLREVASLKNALFDSANYSIISTDPQGLILTFNRAAADMLGYEPEEVIGKVTPAILHDIAEVVCRAAELSKELEHNVEPGFDAFVAKARLLDAHDENEWTYIRKDGTRLPVLLSVTAVRDEIGTITGYLGIAQDISESKHAEEMLEANEKLLRQFIVHTPAAIAMLDTDLCYLQVSEQWVKDYNLIGQNIIGKSHYEIFPDIPEHWKEIHRRVLTGAIERCDEDPFPRADGSTEWLQWEARPWHKSGGEIGGVIFFTQVITARKRAEEELRKSEARLAGILDVAVDAIISVDRHKRITIFNKGAERIFGYKQSEAIGQSLDMLLPEFMSVDHSEEIAQFAASADANRQMGSSREVFGRRKDGTEFPAEISISKLMQGSELIFTSVVRDITERKQSDKEILNHQMQLSEAQRLAQLGSWDWDLIENKLYWSDEIYRIFGFEPQAFSATYEVFLEIVHPDHKKFITKTLARAMSNNEFPEYDTRIIQPNGMVRDIHSNGAVTVDENGKAIRMTGTVQDVTERKQLERELKNACDAALEGARVKSEFLANMSHEIRTPMNGILGLTELMLDTKLDAGQARYIKSIESCSESLLTILNDILDISKVEAGMLNFETIDFDLRYSVENVIELLADRAHRKNLEIAMIFQPDVPMQLCGDPTRLRQIITNLLSNAIKFTDTGEIVINVSKVSEDEARAIIRFDVKDTGIGISEGAKKLLFSPFAQADSSITRLYGGTGLGLAISKKLVEMMDGDISIASEPGHGTTVTFTANFIKQEDQEIVVPPLNLNLKGLRVLIVDDNETNRLILTKQMSEWGIIVDETADGMGGIEKLRACASAGQPFKIAILDQVLPEINGIDIAKLIKADPLIADTHLILMTSYSKRGHGELARQAGIRGYFKKPVRQSELLACLSLVMSKQKPENKIETKLITQHSIGAMKASLNRHILLVEDNEVNQEVALGHLAGLGYRVDVAVNGEEAVKAISRKKYDVVLMDCQMPVMDGFQATAEIRRQEGKTKHTPIIAMTAYAMRSDRDKCLASGMDAYLAKPVKKADLKDILHDLFENKSFGISTAVTDEFEAKETIDIPPVDLVFLMDAASNSYEKLEQYVELYKRHTAERLDELNEAIERRSAGDVFALAHKCLGSSRTLGMTAIVPALRELERIGNSGELRGAAQQLKIAKDGFKKIQMFLEHHLLQNVA